ncbi:hypothetical protein GCM10022281_10480 [Sphingomonas rosea]|uniref:DUF3617 family protein n=1 Tax=Sphingomonas rosea TaxID=335605 RepID=A0ABP7TXZ3_9SPHN
MQVKFLCLVGALALASCGSETAKPKAAAAPAKIPAGTYEVTATVKSLVSADKTPVPTFAKAGDVIKTTGCVGDDGLPAPELFATKGDTCRLENPYARSGRMNLTYNCNRPGKGSVMTMVDGSYTADGFTGTLEGTSSFPGDGDFKLVEEIVAKKTSDQCTAPAAKKA